MCVRASLLHGAENAPYLSREDFRLKLKGVKREKVSGEREIPPTVRAQLERDEELV